MNYVKIYDSLMESRMKLKEERKKLKLLGQYFERHHIIMKSKGGSNKKDNIVYLTAREHFLAHWMLWLIYRDRQTALGFHKMLSKTSKHNRYYSSIGYETARLACSETNKGNKYGKKENQKKPHRMTYEENRLKHSKVMKGMWSGEKNPFYNKKHSLESKEKIKIKAINRNKNGWIPPKSKIVINYETGIFYDSSKLAWESTNKKIAYSTFKSNINGTNKINKIPFKQI